MRNLAQIKTVHPTAFKFRQEKSIPGCYDTGYQLTLECVTDVSSEALKPADLIKRRKVFHDGLVSVVREHHKTFLLSLDPPLSIPEDKVQRWHPDFNLDSLPEVVESPLPQPPLQGGVCVCTPPHTPPPPYSLPQPPLQGGVCV